MNNNIYKIAAVDIGTNTMLMLIAEIDKPSLLAGDEPSARTKENTFARIRAQTRIEEDVHSIARLGEGVDKTGAITPEALQRAVSIAQEYKELCLARGVQTIVAVTTSAARDASNGEAAARALSEALGGAEVRRITGEEEARLSFLGTSETDELCTVVDIGGGSVEYVTGINDIIYRRKSLQMGAVRLHERYFKDSPPDEASILAARAEIRRQLSLLDTQRSSGKLDEMESVNSLQNNKSGEGNNFDYGYILGVGGTFTTLAAIDLGLQEYDSARVHLHSIDAARVREIVHYLCSSPLPDLLKNPAIHPKRADILPAGALILEETLRYFDAPKCTASVKGLRYGVLYDAVRAALFA